MVSEGSSSLPVMAVAPVAPVWPVAPVEPVWPVAPVLLPVASFDSDSGAAWEPVAAPAPPSPSLPPISINIDSGNMDTNDSPSSPSSPFAIICVS